MSQNYQIIDANTTIGLHPTHRVDMSVERLLSEMDRHGITTGLTVSSTGIYHDWQIGNDLALQATACNTRLVPMATVNPTSYFGTADTLQALRAKGFCIFKFCPAEQGWSIDSNSFAKIWKHLAEIRSPVMINTPLMEDITAIGKIASSYPGTIILCSVSLDSLSEAIAVMSDTPNVMLETHELHVTGGLEFAAERTSVERIVFGSGAPRRSIGCSLQYVLKSELSDQQKQMVLGGNIKRILEAGR